MAAKTPRPAKRPAIKKPPVLFNKTQPLLADLSQRLGNIPVLSYWNSSAGNVCGNDVVGFYELLKSIGRQPRLALFIKSDGGSGMAALRIVNLLRQFCDHLTALVPLNCASAATMLALGSDEILMGPLAYLSGTDTSLTHELSPIDKDNDLVSVSQNELERILRLWRNEAKEVRSDAAGPTHPYETLFKYIHPLVVGAVDRASSLSIRLVCEILSYHMSEEDKALRISQAFNSEFPAHNYPVTLREAKRIGVNVNALDPEVNGLLLQLNEHYSEMGQRAITDYDERNYHSNDIPNILEVPGLQVFYQIDKDWHYRTEERRWIPMNDKSSWRKVRKDKGRLVETDLHVR